MKRLEALLTKLLGGDRYLVVLMALMAMLEAEVLAFALRDGQPGAAIVCGILLALHCTWLVIFGRKFWRSDA